MFSAPHKALRRTMAAFSTLAGQTNYNDVEAVEKLKTYGKEMFYLLSSHAENEDKIILSALESRLPGASEHDKQDHIKIEKLQRELEVHLNILSTSVTADEAYDFYLKFAAFHSLYLEHTDEEERVTQKLIWENFSTEEQITIRSSIVAKMKPEPYAVWLKHMIPAQNESENRMMLGAMQKNMPPQNFHSLMEMLEKIMPEEDFFSLSIHLSALAFQS
jgi:hemerythrin-like domain-containing protein